jgi:hypothetical protein
MKKRRITLPDGRYLIFYNFEPPDPQRDKRTEQPETVTPRDPRREPAVGLTSPEPEDS